MKQKIFLNVFYNIAIICSIVGANWAYKNNSPLIVVFFAVMLIAFIYFKFRLAKQIRNDLKK
ncbi:DUF6358 family protein [Pedobacter sp.]|uniref:DUF6358 family protein n=1 Tax=Pedobacter sp. TaxID=1411316 RepID=UPI00396CB3AD